jgi:hypothetical protein
MLNYTVLFLKYIKLVVIMGLREVVETVETRNMHNFFAPLADDLGKFFSGKTIFYLFALSLS